MDINLNLPTLPTQDQKDAMDNANVPDSTNPFATMADVGGSLTLAQVLANGNIVNNYAIQDATGNSSLILVSNSNALYYVDATTSNELSLNPTLNSFRFFDGTKLAYITEDAVMTEISHTDLINLTATSVTKNGVEIATINDLPTKTSDLTNDGDDGNPFISLNDLPSNLILYATNVASDIPTYVKLVSSITDPSYNTVAVNVSTGAITTTNQFISALITLPNLIVGNPGVLNITTIGNIRRTAGTGNAEFYFEVYKRTSGGVETLITTSGNTLPVFNGVYAEFSATALWNDGIFLATDRIVLKFYGSRIAGGSNPTYDFQFGGSSPVRSLVPIPLTVTPFITLDEVADVTITTPVNNDLLAYESSTSLWKNKSAAALGIVETSNSALTDTRIRKVSVQSNTDASTTSTIVETVLKTLLIPTLGANTTLKIMSEIGKVGVAVNAVFKMYYNTTPDLSGTPVQIALLNFTATQVFSPFNRDITNKNSVTANSIFPATASSANAIASTSARTNLDIDLSGKYIVITGKAGSVLDSVRVDNARLLIEE
jgi:hypothetical protein